MEKIQAIKPGPKPRKEDGSDDRRRRVDPPNQPKYPDLKPHKPKPKNWSLKIGSEPDETSRWSNPCRGRWSFACRWHGLRHKTPEAGTERTNQESARWLAILR